MEIQSLVRNFVQTKTTELLKKYYPYSFENSIVTYIKETNLYEVFIFFSHEYIYDTLSDNNVVKIINENLAVVDAEGTNIPAGNYKLKYKLYIDRELFLESK